MSKKLIELSKFLSYVLRHQPQAIGLTLDAEGWAEIEKLIACTKQSGRPMNRQILIQLVHEDDKKRFTISADGSLIRAAQGHSLDAVAIAYQAKTPPEFLYHGTAERFLASIAQKGLSPQKRQYVHLSESPQIALDVGNRYGKPVVLTIPAKLMYTHGIAFYQAENNVWLVEAVSPHWLSMNSPDFNY